MKIFIGNLSFDVTGDILRDEFAAYGDVESADVVTDRISGRSRGFGFVEMPDQSDAEKAIAGLNGKDLMGRNLTVNVSRPRESTGGGARGRRY
ncbi:MAG TPA: RNA-binding protein [Dehalococcoidia bacterium]|nr:RNA-binding protein [Dehalococcoidia bacterium]